MEALDIDAARDIDLAAELAAIPKMSWPDLRQRWTALTGSQVPRVKQALLRMALAWELQARVHGGLSRRTEQCLARRGSAPAAGHTKTGLKLVREWRGVLHTVVVDADQRVHWNGTEWRSLSEVARAITGTRWSGPAFFGLKQAIKQKARAA